MLVTKYDTRTFVPPQRGYLKEVTSKSFLQRYRFKRLAEK